MQYREIVIVGCAVGSERSIWASVDIQGRGIHGHDMRVRIRVQMVVDGSGVICRSKSRIEGVHVVLMQLWMGMRVLRGRYSQVLPWVKKVGIGWQVGEMVDGDMCRDMEKEGSRRLLCHLLKGLFLGDGLVGSTTARDRVRGGCSGTRADRPLTRGNASSGYGA